MTLGSTYLANGTGRDTYISRDPVVHVGITEATPRGTTHNPKGLTPRPPSSLARGSKAAGYTGFLPGRREGIGQNFYKLSEKQDLKNLIPKLRLKHRFVTPPNSQFDCVTSREYGGYFKKDSISTKQKDTKAQTERASVSLPPLIIKPQVYGKVNTDTSYWQQHRVGGPISNRDTQRSTAQDMEMGYSEEAADNMPTTARQLMEMSNVPQGYTGYRPRFRYCYRAPDDGA